MDLEETKKALQSEYDKLISELDNLKKIYKTIKPKYQKMETKDFDLYYELEDLSEELKNLTKMDEENEKQYIKNNSNQLSLKLSLLCGLISSLIITIIFILTSKFIANISYVIPLIIGFFTVGMTAGLGIYTLYKNKYESILKGRYKKSDIHLKLSNNHYDKVLKLMRKKDDYNNYHQEYLKVKDEYINIERELNQKKEELNAFKDKVFNILFPSQKDDLERTEEESLSKDVIPYCDECQYKEEPSSCKKILKKF